MNNDNQLQLVTFEQAKRLKEFGFDLEVRKYYDSRANIFHTEGYFNHNNFGIYSVAAYSAPTVAHALKWFRGKKINADVRYDNGGWQGGYVRDKVLFGETDCFNTYEDAEIALMDLLLTDFKPKR